MARKTRKTAAPAEDFLTMEDKADSAKQAFYRRAAELGNDDWTDSAWANALSAETYAEYANDLERWTIALATLEMLATEAA